MLFAQEPPVPTYHSKLWRCKIKSVTLPPLSRDTGIISVSAKRGTALGWHFCRYEKRNFTSTDKCAIAADNHRHRFRQRLLAVGTGHGGRAARHADVVVSPYALPSITLGAVAVFTVLGTWATGRLMPFWGDDPSRVVVDEMVGVWLPLVVTPAGNVWLALLSFALFRFFDILKPLGIRAIDRQKGAFFVMADDLLAGVYSLVIVLIVRWAL